MVEATVQGPIPSKGNVSFPAMKVIFRIKDSSGQITKLPIKKTPVYNLHFLMALFINCIEIISHQYCKNESLLCYHSN